MCWVDSKASPTHLLKKVATTMCYHRSCRATFSRKKPAPDGDSNGDSSDPFEALFEHLDQSDECQYTLAELEDLLALFSSGDW